MLLFDYLNIILGMFMIVLGVMIGLAYLTLLEQKVLSYIQIRKGPNKVGFIGMFQPFSDGLKLFSKEFIIPILSNYFMFYLMPIIGFFVSLSIWLIIPYYFNLISFNLGFMFFISLLSVGVYIVMFIGWSSNSVYSILGGLRAVAQTISYEVSLILILLSNLVLVMSFNLFFLFKCQYYIWMMFLMMPLSLCFLSSIMAETNRSPFDFAEGESELVSGFNVEYSSGSFALIFLAEYLLFMSLIYVIFYMGGYEMTLIFYFKMIMISFIYIWVRGTLPRYRYDKLMYLCWKLYLPISLGYLMFMVGVKILLI